MSALLSALSSMYDSQPYSVCVAFVHLSVVATVNTIASLQLELLSTVKTCASLHITVKTHIHYENIPLLAPTVKATVKTFGSLQTYPHPLVTSVTS